MYIKQKEQSQTWPSFSLHTIRIAKDNEFEPLTILSTTWHMNHKVGRGDSFCSDLQPYI